MDEAPARAPEPIQSTTEEVEAKPEKPPPADKAAEAKTGERARGPDGKFLAADPKPADGKAEEAKPAKAEKVPGNFSEPPTRFSPDAKTAWKDAPEPVRAEVHRAMREMEQGFQKYREDAQSFAELKDYDAIAKQHGTSIKATMDQYIRLSQVLQSRDPMPAIQELLRHAGMTVQDLVSYVTGQQPDQAAAGSAREIMELRNHISQLQRQLQGEIGYVRSTLDNQVQQGVLGEIQQFAADKPRFDELSMEIAAQVRQGYDLDEAYERAEKLHPLPAALSGATPPSVPAAAQNGAPSGPAVQPRGSLSVTGAPAAGSDPRNRGPSPTTRAALDKVFAQLGLPQ
jgi:hypothetical protein